MQANAAATNDAKCGDHAVNSNSIRAHEMNEMKVQ